MSIMSNFVDWPNDLDALRAGPLPPHTLENVGGAELRILSVEMKDAAEGEVEFRPQP